MIRMDKLTLMTQEALQKAQAYAAEHDHQQIDVEHVLLAMLGQEKNIIVPLLQKLGVNLGRCLDYHRWLQPASTSGLEPWNVGVALVAVAVIVFGALAASAG